MKAEIIKLKQLCNEIKIWSHYNALGYHYVNKRNSIVVRSKESRVESVALIHKNSYFRVDYNEVIDCPPEQRELDNITLSCNFIIDDNLIDTFRKHMAEEFSITKIQETENVKLESEKRRQREIAELEERLKVLKGEPVECTL